MNIVPARRFEKKKYEVAKISFELPRDFTKRYYLNHIKYRKNLA